MHPGRNDARRVEVDQQLLVPAFQEVLVGVAVGIGEPCVARGAVVGHVEEGAGDRLQPRRDLRVMRRLRRHSRTGEPTERSVVMVPAGVELHDIGLSLAQRAGRHAPAAQLNVACGVEQVFLVTQQRLEAALLHRLQHRLVELERRVAVVVGARKMRHAAARHDDRSHPNRSEPARERLPESVAPLHGRLRRQVGVDEDRQHRGIANAQVRHRDAERVVDLGGAGERGIEPGAVEILDQRKPDFAGDIELELASRKGSPPHPAHVQGERRRDVGEELLRVVVADHDPDIGLERLEALADLRRHLLDAGDGRLVLGLGLGEELRGVRQHRAAEDGRVGHGVSIAPS